MAGAVLSPDQVARINAAFPALVGHVRSLLTGDHTAVGLMDVHSMVESINTDYLAKLFAELSYLSPVQKKALVRAALYELIANEPGLFRGSAAPVAPVVRPVQSTDEAPKTFSPPPFKLNVNKTEAFHGAAPTDVNVAKPVVTSTHTSKVAQDVEAANVSMKAEQEKRDAAVARLRASTQPKPIEIASTPEVAVEIPQTDVLPVEMSSPVEE